MASLIALELAENEARLAVASGRGERLTLEHAFTVALPAEAAAAEKGELLAHQLKERGIGRGDVLLLLGRTDVELRQLTLPLVPDDEMPAIVHNVAFREFNEAEEDWLLDYVPIGPAGDNTVNVLAAVVAPPRVAEATAICEAAGLKLRRVLLRAFGAAHLAAQSFPAESNELRLLVDLLAAEVDLTVLRGRQVVFLRTARLSGDPLDDAAARPAFLGELRRTIAAAQSQSGSERIESLLLCGSAEGERLLAAELSEKLGMPVRVVDPLEGFQKARYLPAALPQAERYAPLVGALAAELNNEPQSLDFLHPRRTPPPPSRRNLYVLAGAAVLMVLFAYFIYTRVERMQLQSELKRLSNLATTAEKDAKAAADLENDLARLEAWNGEGVDWLDEIAQLSGKLPPAREVKLTSVTFNGGARPVISMSGLAASAASFEELQEQLSDTTHLLLEKNRTEFTSVKPYSWSFTASMALERPAKAKGAAAPAADRGKALGSGSGSAAARAASEQRTAEIAATAKPPAAKQPAAEATPPTAAATTVAQPEAAPAASAAAPSDTRAAVETPPKTSEHPAAP